MVCKLASVELLPLDSHLRDLQSTVLETLDFPFNPPVSALPSNKTPSLGREKLYVDVI